MDSSIYRFRNTRALLDGFHELENQEIYFASPLELNDPLEGYKNLLWKGDAILWKNFLRHYILCLLQAILRALEHGAEYQVTADTLPIDMIDDDLHPEVRKVFDTICDRVFADPELAPLPALLESRRAPMPRNELLSLLWPVHFRIFPLVCTTLQPEQPIHMIDAYFRERGDRPLRLKESFAALNAIEERRADSPDIEEAMTYKFVSAIEQTTFIRGYNGADQQHGPAWNVIGSTLPEIYLNALEKLLYRDWYTACFVAEPTQAAMWGHYADSHKGVCLKFRSYEVVSGKPGLRLRRPMGIKGSKTDLQVHYDFGLTELYEIQYKDCYPEIDFFRSLGRITRRQLTFWFRGPDGAISETGGDLWRETDEWRKGYWDGYYAAITTKLKDWEHEREYRATLQSYVLDLSERPVRKLQYRFEDLQGIIFGIKTTPLDKAALVRIIQEKCRAAGRKDFELHQAYYARRTGRIATTRWDLVQLG